MNAVPVSWYLLLSAVLFTLGAAGFLFRRNIITVFMSIELMLNAVNLSFITFSHQLKQVNGHIFTFFVMVVAAAEAAVGLGIILTVYKNCNTLNIDDISSLKDAFEPARPTEPEKTESVGAPGSAPGVPAAK